MSEINQIKQIQFNMPTKDENGKPTVTTTQYTFTPSIDDIEYNGMPLPEIIENIKNGTVEVGKAKEADKLSANAGNENTPIYFQDGKPVAIEGAKLTDTTYDAAGQDLGLIKSGGVATIKNGIITNISKATQDGNGNNIANTYATQTSLHDLEQKITNTVTDIYKTKITANTTWTVPENIKTVKILLFGAGGGGGGTNCIRDAWSSARSGGGGGGGGGHLEICNIKCNAGDILSFELGSGGTGGNNGYEVSDGTKNTYYAGTNGSKGGSSKLFLNNVLIATAEGGSGGRTGNQYGSGGDGGDGGTGGGGGGASVHYSSGKVTSSGAGGKGGDATYGGGGSAGLSSGNYQDETVHGGKGGTYGGAGGSTGPNAADSPAIGGKYGGNPGKRGLSINFLSPFEQCLLDLTNSTNKDSGVGGTGGGGLGSVSGDGGGGYFGSGGVIVKNNYSSSNTSLISKHGGCGGGGFGRGGNSKVDYANSSKSHYTGAGGAGGGGYGAGGGYVSQTSISSTNASIVSPGYGAGGKGAEGTTYKTSVTKTAQDGGNGIAVILYEINRPERI